MAYESDESDSEPQAPKNPRRGGAESQEESVITPYVVKKLEEGFSQLLGVMKALLARYQRRGDCIKIFCPFSPYSVFPRQGTNWETNLCAGRIVLHSNLSSGTALQHDFVIRKVG